MKPATAGKAYGLLFLTFFIWGSVYVGGKLISDQVPPALLGCLRCLLGMIPLTLMSKKYFGKVSIDREDWKWFFLVGLTGYFLTIFLVQLGISLTGAAMAALINALTPVSVTIMAAVILKEHITPVKLICLALALAGTVVITGGAGSQGEMAGALSVLIAVCTWGIASVYMRRLTAKYPAVLVTTIGTGFSLLFHVPLGVYTAMTQPVDVSPLCIVVVLYLAWVGSGVAQYSWTRSLSILPASTCSLFYPLQPMFSALLGAIILHETFGASFFVGLLLISLDVVLNTWETRRAAGSGRRT